MTHPLEDHLSRVVAKLPEPGPSRLESIRLKSRQLDRTVVVLDDDPTGTQTVHDVNVYTRWDRETFISEFENESELFFILTNSRSLPEQDAVLLNRRIGEALMMASQHTGREFEVISRSDSTLRGHYPAEVDALAAAVGQSHLPQLFIPYFREGKRITVNDIHYVVEDDLMIPASETPFAQDTAFGYRHSNLKDYVQEKTNGRIHRDEVSSISIEALRTSPSDVSAQLGSLTENAVCIVNCLTMNDMEAFVDALLTACSQGKKFVYRTAASFVQARGGMSTRALLTHNELRQPNSQNGGLIVVGSFVTRTTQQLEVLRKECPDLEPIEIDVTRLIEPHHDLDMPSIKEDINRLIQAGKDVVLFTSREQHRSGSVASDLENGKRISNALVQLVAGLSHKPRFLIAKGGITSSDIATESLQVVKARVRGQILPGVPVWELGRESRFPGMSYVIFPGNVGDQDAVAEAYKKVAN